MSSTVDERRGAWDGLFTEGARYLVLSCRHCTRPVSVTRDVDETERVALRRHLGGCAPDVSKDADVLRHFHAVPSR